MFLAFLLDFQKDVYVKAAVAPYGRVLAWYTNENKSRFLLEFCFSAQTEFLVASLCLGDH